MIKHAKIDPEIVSTMSFNKAKETALDIMRATKRNEQIMDIGKQPHGLREMTYEYGQANIGQTKPKQSSTTVAREDKLNEQIGNLTSSFQALSLPLQAIANQGDACNFNIGAAQPATSCLDPALDWNVAAGAPLPTCFYCGRTGCCKDCCPELHSD